MINYSPVFALSRKSILSLSFKWVVPWKGRCSFSGWYCMMIEVELSIIVRFWFSAPVLILGKKKMDEKVDASISEVGSANACSIWLAYWNDWLRGYESENSKGKSKESGGIGVPRMLDGNKIPSNFKNDLVGVRTSLCPVVMEKSQWFQERFGWNSNILVFGCVWAPHGEIFMKKSVTGRNSKRWFKEVLRNLMKWFLKV